MLIIEHGTYTFHNRPLSLIDWVPDYKMSNESMRVVPKWVLLPSLPLQFWIAENLGRIRSFMEPVKVIRIKKKKEIWECIEKPGKEITAEPTKPRVVDKEKTVQI
ncbi:hypothetical protein BC332_02070 [Capsicum chinense]|nr:hypothetical protein BC332_02070 [Capsicum chinense]